MGVREDQINAISAAHQAAHSLVSIVVGKPLSRKLAEHVADLQPFVTGGSRATDTAALNAKATTISFISESLNNLSGVLDHEQADTLAAQMLALQNAADALVTATT